MIVSMIIKRMIRSGILRMNEDDFNVDSLLALWRDDCIWDGTSEFGIGRTIEGKKAITDWFRKWKEEFPKRTIDVKDICFSAWPFCLRNVITVQWSLTETDKQGKTFKYDGVSVVHTRNFKIIRFSEYLSFIGLPKLSDLIEPLTED